MHRYSGAYFLLIKQIDDFTHIHAVIPAGSINSAAQLRVGKERAVEILCINFAADYREPGFFKIRNLLLIKQRRKAANLDLIFITAACFSTVLQLFAVFFRKKGKGKGGLLF